MVIAMEALGFTEVPNWPSVYTRPGAGKPGSTTTFLLYVDDLVMHGEPKELNELREDDTFQFTEESVNFLI